MEKMDWRAQQGVACLLNRHWRLVLAFSFMNVSVKREWATAWPPAPLRRARAAGAARPRPGAGHGGTHISSHRCVVARAAPPSPWLPPRAASNAACLTARGIAPWGMGLLYTSHIFIYEITFVLALHCQWGPAARLHTHTTLVTETVSRMSSNASLAARGALWRFGSPVRPPARSVVARDERSEDAYLSRL